MHAISKTVQRTAVELSKAHGDSLRRSVDISTARSPANLSRIENSVELTSSSSVQHVLTRRSSRPGFVHGNMAVGLYDEVDILFHSVCASLAKLVTGL